MLDDAPFILKKQDKDSGITCIGPGQGAPWPYEPYLEGNVWLVLLAGTSLVVWRALFFTPLADNTFNARVRVVHANIVWITALLPLWLARGLCSDTNLVVWQTKLELAAWNGGAREVLSRTAPT
jgi:hypothetical protein